MIYCFNVVNRKKHHGVYLLLVGIFMYGIFIKLYKYGLKVNLRIMKFGFN